MRLDVLNLLKGTAISWWGICQNLWPLPNLIGQGGGQDSSGGEKVLRGVGGGVALPIGIFSFIFPQEVGGRAC